MKSIDLKKFDRQADSVEKMSPEWAATRFGSYLKPEARNNPVFKKALSALTEGGDAKYSPTESENEYSRSLFIAVDGSVTYSATVIFPVDRRWSFRVYVQQEPDNLTIQSLKTGVKGEVATEEIVFAADPNTGEPVFLEDREEVINVRKMNHNVVVDSLKLAAERFVNPNVFKGVNDARRFISTTGHWETPPEYPFLPLEAYPFVLPYDPLNLPLRTPKEIRNPVTIVPLYSTVTASGVFEGHR